jgi:hypothetical protein
MNLPSQPAASRVVSMCFAPRPVWVLVAIALLAAPVLVRPGTSTAAKEEAAPDFATRVQPLLNKYCYSCHEGPKAKAKFRLDTLAPEGQPAAWKSVHERIASREMPPAKNPQPTAEEAATITRWISARYPAQPKPHGRVVLRRLNRTEYQNTLRDLLGVEVDVKNMLPEDASAEGFDNVAAALRLSSVHMQRYLEAADAALDVFFAGKGPEPATFVGCYSYLQERVAKESGGLRVLRTDDAAVILNANPGDYSPYDLRQFYARATGKHHFRILAYGHNGKRVTTAIYADRNLVGYFDVPPGEPTWIDFTCTMRRGATINTVPYRLGYGNKQEDPTVRGLGLIRCEVEGPLFDTWPPAGYQRLIGDVELKSGTMADAERILRAFLPRAFRRPVRDAELRPYLELVRAGLEEKRPDAFEAGLRSALAAVLCSPHFLFLVEKPGPLDDYAIAARLSYFLCSTMPDDELTQLAARGRLKDRWAIHEQVERLLRSPRAKAFTENFLGQWLELRKIDFTTPERNHYPQFDELLKISMVQETHAFFEEILNNDLSVLNFVDSDFAMLNRPLAELYDVPGVDGLQMQKVRLPGCSHRGGLMTQASILKVTANGSSTSPVIRGAWVLKNILGKPPPPPPPNVPAVEPDIRGAKTMRELLAKHRNSDECGSCHRKIDPVGFALENYDVIGAWRDHYRTGDPRVQDMIEVRDPNGKIHKFRRGMYVDASDALPDGRDFQNLDELKQLLLADPEPIVRCVAEKLLVYATGAAPDDVDRATLRGILQRRPPEKYGLRTLIHELVESELFLKK